MSCTNLEMLERSISRRQRSITAEQLRHQQVLAAATGKTPAKVARPRRIKPRLRKQTRAELARERAELLVIEVQWLAGTDTDDSIARRLGYPAAANLRAALRRIATRHPDLAPRCAL